LLLHVTPLGEPVSDPELSRLRLLTASYLGWFEIFCAMGPKSRIAFLILSPEKGES
jgi:hypothetical protein